MKKRELKAIFASFLMASTVLAACGSQETAEKPKEEKQEQTASEDKAEEKEQEVDFSAVYKEALTELDKAKEQKEVDFAMVTDLYTKNLQSLVQKRDAEFEAQHDQHITAALKAGQDGSMDPIVVRQIFDKLMQKVFYTTVKHEFTEVVENWGNKDSVKEEIEEAKGYYAILKSTVEKRDAAYGTNMVSVIDGGFAEIEKAVEADDQLGFQLGKQVVDKTMMKTFYFATGAIPNGYATKAAAEAKENPEVAKIEQAEGWAFYQSISSYLNSHSPEEAAFIESQFNLETDVASLDPAAVNKAFVRGFSKVALDEYAESLEAWGEDKSSITALEGALFIDVIGEDIKGIIGDEAYKTLTEQAGKYLEAAKAKDKAAGEPVLAEIQATLQNVMAQAK
ncbi:hypothetical protein [Neobacillus sp. DY30]|uniref:hypothetical protein n=1 Tax=Neobacillus sp. DY30 TaxID=3047871 RepID=UPI0024BFE1D7|nr:hypothetical protein [Neobacillus sp. DY30]WHY00922.1 hypothetical protein QNH29_01065 [Neobacillus sp. DY30]